MPKIAKPKPTSVIRHEIVLGKVEREMAEHLAITKSVDNLVRPVALLGIAGGAVYASYQLARFVSSFGEVPDKIEQWFVDQAGVLGKKGGDVASTIIDPTGAMADKTGATFGEKIEIGLHALAIRMGILPGPN